MMSSEQRLVHVVDDDAANAGRHELRLLECRLTVATTALAKGPTAVCLFANDQANATTIMAFAHMGIRLIPCVRPDSTTSSWLRRSSMESWSQGFPVILSLVRNVHRAYNRAGEGNFSLDGCWASISPTKPSKLSDRETSVQ